MMANDTVREGGGVRIARGKKRDNSKRQRN